MKVLRSLFAAACMLVSSFVLFLLMMCIFLYLFDSPRGKIINSVGGYTSKQVFTSGGFQDYTDYAKYSYGRVDLDGNKYLRSITSDSKKALLEHIDNFEKWVNAIKTGDPTNELVVNYDFDSSVITDGDFVYITDDPGYDYLGCYDVYFFDSESNTLFFFHNNV